MRTSSPLAGFVVVLLVSSGWCRPASGQWAVIAEVGAHRFWGGSIEATAEHRSFRPYRPTTFGVGLERKAGRLGAGLRLRYASASLALEGPDALSAAKGVFDIYSVAPEVMYRIATVGTVNQLVLHAGPLFEVWSVIGADTQTRLGVHGAVSLNLPLGGRFRGSLTVGAALIPSPFEEGQLDPPFERRTLWRRSLGVGVDYRL